ncbi:MAG: histidine kinase [Pirellulaceae bacterium]
MTAAVVYLTNDLLFSSRVGAVAGARAVEVAVVRSLSDLTAQLAGGKVRLVLVDLDHRDADMPAVRRSVTELSSPRALVVAYASHVKEDRLAAAARAGADRVLSRGQFDRQLSEILDLARDVASDSPSSPE